MSWFTKVLSSSIGRKLAVGLSGLGLVGFLVGHLLGNLNLYLGASALDAYAEDLHHIPGFPLIELGLLVMFLVHIPLVIWLSRENKAARASRYAASASKRTDGVLRSIASRSMKMSGVLMLVFLVVHIADFRLERSEFHAADGGVEGLGVEVITALGNPLLAALYIVGGLLAAWHVFHGFQSAFRSLGFNHTKYTPAIEKLGVALALVLGLGFASIPIAVQVGVIAVDDADVAAAVDCDEPGAACGEPAEADDH